MKKKGSMNFNMKKEEEYTGNTKGGTWSGSPMGIQELSTTKTGI